MKRVAIIAPDFAPSSMPPSMCIRFLAGNLKQFGWDPIVITTDPKYYEHAFDPDNLELLPPDLRVIRVGAISTRITKLLGFSDLGLRSFWQYWISLSKLHKTETIDAVLINMPPFVPMIVARLAYLRFRTPYILNYTDPWRTDYYSRIPKDARPTKWRLAELLARTLEPFAVGQASALIGVSRATTDMVIKNYPTFDSQKTFEIPCGGATEDFEFIRRHPRTNTIFNRDDGLVHISSTGHFNPQIRHAADAFFDALLLGLRYEPELFGRLRVHFVGTTYAANEPNAYQVLPIAREKGVEHLVTELPTRLSYLDSLQVMADSHGLLMLGNPSPHYTASKVFPYVLSRRPILALFHEQSSVVKILDETRAGHSVTFSSERPLSGQVETIYRELSAMISQPRSWQPPTHWEAFEQYTARAMAQRLANVLNRVVAV